MAKLPTTDYISPNEGAILYSEVNLPGPLFDEPHRFMVIKVIRNDKPAIYTQDLGPARNFVGVEVNIPGGQWDERTGKGETWDTVGNLMGIAELIRNRSVAETEALMVEAGHELTEKSPEQWQNDYYEAIDKRQMAARKT